MASTSDQSLFQADAQDNLMFLGPDNDDSLPNNDLFFSADHMITDLEDTDLFSTTSLRQPNVAVNPAGAHDDSTASTVKREPGQIPMNNVQMGSPPDEASEDSSSSDDSGRHKRKSSSMSFQTSNDGDFFDTFKAWGDGNTLGPALSHDNSARNTVTGIDQEMSNEDMEIHFDFKSAASSPRPATTSVKLKQAPSSSVSNMTRNSNRQSSVLIKSTEVSPSACHSPPESAPPQHIFRTSVAANAGSPQDCAARVAGLSGKESAVSPIIAQGYGSDAMNAKAPTAPEGVRLQMSPRVTSMMPAAVIPPAKCNLFIHPIPQKSRVETQINLKITIFPLPDGIKKMHLPTYTISKPKLIQRPKHEKSPDTLELYSMLVCTSAMQDKQKRTRAFALAAAKTREQETGEASSLAKPSHFEQDDPENPLNGGEVNICTGCITRERKRAARKKSKKPEEEAAWANDEVRRVIVFNTNEVRQWEDPSEEDPSLATLEFQSRGRQYSANEGAVKQIKMPMRIACYCRHHSEKMGFQVILTIKDHQDQLVAQSISQPIVITDDHKAQPPAAVSPSHGMPLDGLPPWTCPEAMETVPVPAQLGGSLQRNAFSSNDLQAFHQQISHQHQQQQQQQYNPRGFRPFASVQSTPSAAFNAPAAPNRSAKSRQVSPSAGGGPLNKKRKSSGGARIPESLVMTKSSQVSPSQINTTLPTSAATSASYSLPLSAATSPFSNQFPSQSLPQAPQNQQRTPHFPSGPPTPDSSTNDFFAQLHRSQSFDTNTAAQPMFSQPSSNMPSRAPSPSSLAHTQGMQSNISRPALASTFPNSHPQLQQRSAVINKIIPTQGPTSGGIEVTCLGSGFYQGVEVMFGDALATTTTYWGDSTLVCLLPPADRPGQVPVTLKHQYEQLLTGTRHGVNATFTYIDGTEQDMLRQALVIMGQKMTGRVEDAGDILRRMFTTAQSGSDWTGYGTGNDQHRQALAFELGIASDSGTEDVVLQCLDFIDMDENPYLAQLDLPCYNGQTILHLASSLGYRRLAAGLLARGANPNMRDRNGYTPLHMASLRGNVAVARRLLFAGGDPLLRSHLGFRAAELTNDIAVLQTLRHPADTSLIYQNDLPTISGVQFWSRRHGVSQLTPPISRAQSATQYDAGDEWGGSSSEEDEDGESSSDESHQWSQPRRNSASTIRALTSSKALDRFTGSPSPVAAMAAWREQLTNQVQQFQHSMESMLPQLQIPALPAIPPLPNIPSYQAPSMVRRLSNLVPQRVSRPGNLSEGGSAAKAPESRWWDFFSAATATTISPPSYDEIYPDGISNELERKAVVSTPTTSHNLQERISASKTELCKASESALRFVAPGSVSEIDEVDVALSRRKRLRSDRNLFFIWIPLLLALIVIGLKDRLGQYSVWDFSNLAGSGRDSPAIKPV